MPSQTIDGEQGLGPATRRRKIRKGTLSCWSCKRQKSRCEFLRADDNACVACKRRGLRCVRQDEPERMPTGSREDLLARLTWVESQLQEVLHSKKQHSRPPTSPPGLGDHHLTGSDLAGSLQKSLNHMEECHKRQALTCRALLDMWPNEVECQAILTIPYKIVKLASLLVNKCVGMMEELDLNSLTSVPVYTAHPTLHAKKALTLAIVLQGVVLQVSPTAHPSQKMFANLMARMVGSASNLITTDHDLIQTVDGVQCMALESMYYNNSGRLRDAWLVIRRAMTAAQLIGIEQASRCPARTLKTSTSMRSDPQHMWLSLVQSDQYLSMMLGLSTGVSALRPTDSAFLTALHPFERLERMHCYAADLILQRSGDPSSFDKRKVDAMLKDAAACMPASWWLPADGALLSGFDDDQVWSLKDEAFVEVGRVMKHLIHYHLVIQLHIPDFLRPSDCPDDFYSRITAINTSRDLVTRYLTFRNASTQSYWYCRGIDMLAFIASTVISLGHILMQNSVTPAATQSAAGGSLDFLAHQRLTDRGLLDSVLNKMRLLTDGGTDKISLRIVSILQPLLELESKAAAGVKYQLSFDRAQDNQTFPIDRECGDSRETLSIHVPCSGVLHIRPITVADTLPTSGSKSGRAVAPDGAGGALYVPQSSTNGLVNLEPEPVQLELASDMPHEVGTQDFLPAQFDIDLDDWALQGVDSVFFDNLLQGTSFYLERPEPEFQLSHIE